VYWLNTLALNAGTPPYEVAGYRWVRSTDNFVQAVLNEYFKGPGYTEKYVYRWAGVYSGFTARAGVADGITRAHGLGVCAPPTTTTPLRRC
jgi:hypothetical protein